MGVRSGSVEPDLKLSFILITKTFPGFAMDVHPGMENDNSSLPNANPPSDTEDDCGDKLSAAKTYFKNSGHNMKK
jgi:hypothetical protein